MTKLFFLYVGWWLIPLITIWIYRNKLSKYPIEVTIYEKRGENVIASRDVAGRFNDPITEYKLKMSKDTIPIPNYDWILQFISKPTNLFEKCVNLLSGKIGHLTLFKYGSKQYKPVKVRIPDGQIKQVFKEIRDNNGNLIYITVYEPINVKRVMSNLEFEVIDWDDINHMTQELRAIAARRSPLKSFLEKWAGHIIIAVAALVFIIAVYYSKELILDAGDKYLNTIKPNTAVTTPQTPVATGSNVPIIGQYFAPGT